MPAEMHAKSQRIEERAGAQDALVPGRRAGDIGERIRRIGDGDQHRIRRGAHDLRHDVAIDRGVLIEQF